LLGEVEEKLKRMEEGKIIQVVTEPTERVAPIIPVVKPNGKIRICVDLKKLNQAVRRERYVIPTVDDVIHEVKGSSVFSVQARCCLRVPADFSRSRECKADYIHNPIRQIALHLSTIWHQFGSRDISEDCE